MDDLNTDPIHAPAVDHLDANLYAVLARAVSKWNSEQSSLKPCSVDRYSRISKNTSMARRGSDESEISNDK